MDKIKHWYNITNYLTKLNGDAGNLCRMYYVERCRQISNNIELPKQTFGPTVMCSHCGSFWSKNEFRARVIPGKNPSKSVQQMIKSCSADSKKSRFQATLVKKSLKNKMNKIVIKCSVCLKNNEFACAKPNRLKIQKQECPVIDNSISKKKKKKVKDKTAGLNISHVASSDINEEKKTIPIQSTTIKVKTSKKKEATPLQKVRKMNLTKLNSILNDSKVQKSKSSLNCFLKELY